MAFTEQMSLRVSKEQRAYIKEQLDAVRSGGPVGSVKEADIVRAIIERARATGLQLRPTGADE